MNEKVLRTLDGGVGKILNVYEDRCTISIKKGAMSFMTGNFFNGEKEFLYANISSIQFKPAGALVNGFIQFEFPGAVSGKDNFGSENSFIYQRRSLPNEDVEPVVDFIRHKVKTSKQQATTVTNALSPAEELKKFKDLLDVGVISQEEFDTKKKQLLGL